MHSNSGVAAATCLMVNGAVSKFMSNLPDSVIPISPSTTTPGSGGGVNIATSTRPITQGMMYLVDGELLTEQELKLKLNASLTLLIGIIQLLMGEI